MSSGGSPAPADLPEHACAIIADPRGRLLLELRPPQVRHSANRMTCFGGKREPGETAADCLRRELAEELGWDAATGAPVCELRDGGRFIAVFFAVPWRPAPIRCLPGVVAVLAPPAALPGLPVSAWHLAAIRAAARGERLVDLSG